MPLNGRDIFHNHRNLLFSINLGKHKTFTWLFFKLTVGDDHECIVKKIMKASQWTQKYAHITQKISATCPSNASLRYV